MRLRSIDARWLALAVFCAFLLSRWLTAPFTCCSPEYQSDGALDACVKPWQLITGQPIHWGDTTYLPMALYLLVSLLFGFDVSLVQLVTAFLMAGSMAVLFLGLDRAIGRPGALATTGLLAVSLPFITHGSLPTNTASSLWGVSVVLYLLTLPPSETRVVLLGLVSALSLLAYAAGVVTMLPLVAFHVLLFRRAWPARRLLLLGASLGVGIGGVAALRHSLRGASDLMHWGIDTLSPPTWASYLDSVRIILEDIFVAGLSWYSGSHGHPYLSWPVSALVLIGTAAVAAARLLPRAIGDRVELGNDRARWLVLFLLTTLVAITLASVNTREPGVRRVYSAIVFLFAVAGTAPFMLRHRIVRPALVLLLLAALALESFRSASAIRSEWRHEQRDAATQLSALLRDVVENKPYPVSVFVDDREFESHRDWLFCGAYFDRVLRRKITALYAFHQTETGLEFLRDGNSQRRETVSNWSGPAIVLARSTREAQAVLEHFENPYLVKIHLLRIRQLE